MIIRTYSSFSKKITKSIARSRSCKVEITIQLCRSSHWEAENALLALLAFLSLWFGFRTVSPVFKTNDLFKKSFFVKFHTISQQPLLKRVLYFSLNCLHLLQRSIEFSGEPTCKLLNHCSDFWFWPSMTFPTTHYSLSQVINMVSCHILQYFLY